MNFFPLFVCSLAGLGIVLPAYGQSQKNTPPPVSPPAEKKASGDDFSISISGDLNLSEDTPVSTWKEALSSAYEKNPELKTSQSHLRETQESRKQAWGEWVPKPSGVLNQSATDQKIKSLKRDTLYESRRGGFQVSQSLFSGGGTVARLKQSSRRIQAAEASLVASESSILLNALSAFLGVYTAQESLDVLKQNEEVTIKILEQTRARFEVGEITYTDVLTQESEVATSTARRVSDEGALATARAHFESVVGKPAAQKLVWPKDIPLDIPEKLDQAIALSLKNNPSLRSAFSQEEAARFHVNSVFGRTMLPSVNATGSALRQQDRQKFTVNEVRVPERGKYWQRDLRAEVTMEMPIPTGVPQSEVRVAEQQKAQATFARQKTQLEVREAIVKAWSDHQTALKNVIQFQVEVKAAQQAFEGAREEYTLGLKSVIDLASIQTKLLQAQLQLIGAKQNVIVTKAQIQSLLGGFLTKNLRLAVHQYNPEMTNTWFGIKD